MVPLIDVPEIGWDFETEKDAKTLDEHVAKVPSRVRGKWGKRPCFVDGRLLPSEERMETGVHAMRHVFSGLRSEGCLAVPVTGPERAPQYQSAIRRIIIKDGRGVCVRAPLENAARSTFKTTLDDLLAELGVKHDQVHFVLDLGAPSFDPIDGFSKLVANVIRALPQIDQWRTFTLLGTSFPKTMGEVKTSPTALPRSEWVLYKEVVDGLRKTGHRIPAFGDYAIQHPDAPRFDMRKVKPAASIRYSADDIWYIIKGPNVKDNKFEQYREHCRTLMASTHYAGPAYSHGDNYIAECARGAGSTGNLMMWRCVGTNHHLERVVRDVASFFGSSSSS